VASDRPVEAEIILNSYLTTRHLIPTVAVYMTGETEFYEEGKA
jgi:hypothetical protein